MAVLGAASHHHPPGDAQQVGVLELDTGPLIAVIEQGIEAGVQQAGVELFAQLALAGLLEVGNHHDHLKGGNRHGPTDAIAVVVLFHGGLGQARDANAVAAHRQGFLGSAFVGEAGAEGFGILAAQLENVAHLDAAGGREGLLGIVEAAIARLGGAKIDHLRLELQARPAGSDPVKIRAIAAANEGVQLGGRGIGQPQQLGHQPGLGLGGQSCIANARRGLGGGQDSVA